MIKKEQYLEKTSHGTAMFPVEYYHCVYPEGLAGLPVHWHEEFEITSVRKGQCVYMIDLAPCPVEEGDFLFLPTGVLHGIPEGKIRFLETDSFVFHPDMLGNRNDVCQAKYVFPTEKGEIRFPAVIRGESSACLNRIFEMLKEVFLGKTPGYEMEVKALLLHLLYQLFRTVPYEKSSPENAEVVDKLKTALQYIKDHYQRPISIREVADACHFSEYYFMRFFKQYMNMTCVEYLNQYRLEIAAGKLAGSSASVTAIALDSGFNNISYFNRIFKRSFGMTPKSYRKTALAQRQT